MSPNFLTNGDLNTKVGLELPSHLRIAIYLRFRLLILNGLGPASPSQIEGGCR